MCLSQLSVFFSVYEKTQQLAGFELGRGWSNLTLEMANKTLKVHPGDEHSGKYPTCWIGVG